MNRIFILLTALLLSLPSAYAQHDFAKAYESFLEAKCMTFTVSAWCVGRMELLRPKSDLIVAVQKSGSRWDKFRIAGTEEVMETTFSNFNIYTDTTLYGYDFMTGRFRNMGSLYAIYKGKKMMRTPFSVVEMLRDAYAKMYARRSEMTRETLPDGAIRYAIMSADQEIRAEFFFSTEGIVPYRAILYDHVQSTRDYLEIRLSDVRVNPVFHEAFFMTPETSYAEVTATTRGTRKEEKGKTGGNTPAPVSSAVSQASPEVALLATGTKAPDWVLPDLKGETIRLKDYAGKYVILDFWATWCPPCVVSLPAMQDMQERFGDKLAVIGVNISDQKKSAEIRSFLDKRNITYQIVRADESVGQAYRASVLPVLYVIDREGKIVLATTGYSREQEDNLIRFLERELAN